MVAYTVAQRNADEGIRPFLMQRDLAQLANLIEVAFSQLDQSGTPIVAEMRRLARAGPLLWLFGAAPTLFPPLMGGYVWIADGQMVGNATLTLESGRRGLWSIGNVAVHPDFRGQGIAHKLIKAALQEASSRGAQFVILEVRTDNTAAQRLYRDLGFEVYDTRAELSLPARRRPRGLAQPSLPLRKRRPDDWQALYDLGRAATPARAQEVRPIPLHHYRMGMDLRFARWLDDLLGRRRSDDCVLEENGQITALLQLTGQYRQAAHRLLITVHPESRGTVEDDLLAAGLYRLNRLPAREIASTVSLSHPEARRAFLKAGFQDVRLLDQMRFAPSRATDRTMT
jgi:ribosomal protein S18 acetylase RimI-like enzyme